VASGHGATGAAGTIAGGLIGAAAAGVPPDGIAGRAGVGAAPASVSFGAAAPAGSLALGAGASPAPSSPSLLSPPSDEDFCLRAYATVRPREILDTLGVCLALAMSFRCHANAPCSK
jgi:hypothetical protein